MFEFQNLEVYKKSKVFHITCKTLLTQRKLDGYVRDQLGRASFSIASNIAFKEMQDQQFAGSSF